MQLSWFEFLLRLLPESFLIILAGYALVRKKIDMKWYLLVSFLHATLTFGIKHIPIAQEYNMILSAILAVILLVAVIKIKAVYSILSTLICFILSIILEFANMAVLALVFKLPVENVFKTSGPILRTIYGLPSLFVFALIIITTFLIRTRKGKLENDCRR